MRMAVSAGRGAAGGEGALSALCMAENAGPEV